MKTITIGKKLRKIRRDLDITQPNLAKKLNVTSGYISKYENNELLPSIKVLIKLSNIFKISLDELLLNKTFNEKINDTILYDKFLKIQHLDKDKKDVIYKFLDSFSE